MPCRGCYGPPEGVTNQGSKLLSAIGALIDTDDGGDAGEEIDHPKDIHPRYFAVQHRRQQECGNDAQRHGHKHKSQRIRILSDSAVA